jgi:hypothetical protein
VAFPEKTPESAVLQAKLAPFESLRMNIRRPGRGWQSGRTL